MKSKIKIILTFAFILLSLAPLAQAALVNCDTMTSTEPCDLGALLSGVFTFINFLLGSASLVAMSFILVGAGRMILAAGDSGQIQIAKQTITRAIMGLLLVIFAYLIITSVTSYITGRSFEDLRKNYFISFPSSK